MKVMRLRKKPIIINSSFDELDQAQLQDNEQESLEEDVARLENAEEIKTELNKALQISDQSEYNLLSLLTELKQVLSGLSSYSASYEAP